MSEQAVFSARAVVYYYDANTKAWGASPVAGFTRLDIYVHSGTGAARVIGRGFEDASKVVINSNINKDTAYQKARDTFHQWTDARSAYGLNFSTKDEADAFAAAFDNASKGPSPAGRPAPAPAAPAPSPPVASTPKPGPPAPPGKAPPPPAPPKAPPKPPASSSNAAAAPVPPSEPGRNALLGSIQGFSKNKLKKADTNDRSGLVPEKKPSQASIKSEEPLASPKKAAGSGGGGGGGGGGDMMAEMLKRQNALKSGGGDKPAAPRPAPPTAKAKPPPPPSGPPPTAARTTSSSSISEPLPDHLQQLKEEILAEFRAELAQFKAEILEHLSR